MSDTDHPGGVFAALDTERLRSGKPDRATFRTLPRTPVRVVLDGVSRPYNIGAIFRLCDAFRVERLDICGVPVDPRCRRLRQAARGAEKWVPWTAPATAADAVARARADGFQIVVAELTAASVGLGTFAPRFPVCLVLGSETGGVSAAVAARADAAIAIPMLGMANSINVSTAAAIVLHHLVRTAQQADR